MTRGRPAVSPTNRRLVIFAAVSIALHLLLPTAALVIPGLLPEWRKPPKPDAPLPTIEFITVQQKGFGKPTSPDAPSKPTPEAPPTPPEEAAKQPPPPQPPAKTQPAKAEPSAKPEPPAAKAPEPPPPPDPTAEAAPAPPPPPPPPAPPQESHVTATPVPPPAARPAPKAEPAPEINLGGTDSLSSLIATGSQIIPVGIDTKLRNREPIYPNEAARLGQHGLVVVRAHVSPDGHAEGVDIEKSSGYPLLDNAARDAVITWHFRPAIDGGVPVQSTISVAIDFTFR